MSPLLICATALVAVFIVLVVLAVVIRLITLVFPSSGHEFDPATMAAVSAAVAATYPDARVTRIEEQP